MNVEQLGNIKLLNCDCIDYLITVPDKYFDLAIVDPPYGINAGKMTMGSGKHKFTKGKEWDSGIPTAEYFEQLFRVSQNQIIWGQLFYRTLKAKPTLVNMGQKEP